MSDFKVMLAKTYEQKRIKVFGPDAIYVEPKLDGVRVIAHAFVEDKYAMFFSRNGRSLDMLKHLQDELVQLTTRLTRLNKGYNGSAFFDGELISATGKFEDISGVIHRKEVTGDCLNARIHLFHAMPLEHFRNGEDKMPQLYRLLCLQEAFTYHDYKLLKVAKPIAVVSHEGIMKKYRQFRELGHEGAMVKDLGQPWIAKRTHAWMKVKAEETADVKIIGFLPGKGKYDGTLGSLICKYKGRKVKVAGMDDAQRDDFFKKFKYYKGKIIEVEYQNVTNKGSLRHPRFKRLRPDKDRK